MLGVRDLRLRWSNAGTGRSDAEGRPDKGSLREHTVYHRAKLQTKSNALQATGDEMAHGKRWLVSKIHPTLPPAGTRISPGTARFTLTEKPAKSPRRITRHFGGCRILFPSPSPGKD